MKAWIFQRQKHQGIKGSPWIVGWYDLDGKRREKQLPTKKQAEKFCARKANDLAEAACGTADCDWDVFQSDFESSKLAGRSLETRTVYVNALEHFKRIVKPKRVGGVTARSIDTYVAARLSERGRKQGSTTSPATVNKELRAIKRALRVANEWGFLRQVPAIEFVREPEKLPRYVTSEDFQVIYAECKTAKLPEGLPYDPVDWWQAYLVFQYMTGWRMSEPLKLKRSDVDLVNGFAITRHGDNKGKKDARVPLHPVVIDHLQNIKALTVEMFPWPHGRRSYWDQFHAIQRAAGIHLECHEKHEHSPTCHVYGFHDLRRSFATHNAGNLTASELQGIMRHQSYATTQKYINMAAQLNDGVTNRLTVPRGLDTAQRSKDSRA